NTHRYRSDREIGFATHGGHSYTCLYKSQQLLLHIGGDVCVAIVLYIATVNAESRQTFLCVTGQCCCQVHSSWSLCAIKAPNSFGDLGIIIDGLTAITPTRSHCDGQSDTFLAEFLGAGSCFVNATD